MHHGKEMWNVLVWLSIPWRDILQVRMAKAESANTTHYCNPPRKLSRASTLVWAVRLPRKLQELQPMQRGRNVYLVNDADCLSIRDLKTVKFFLVHGVAQFRSQGFRETGAHSIIDLLASWEWTAI